MAEFKLFVSDEVQNIIVGGRKASLCKGIQNHGSLQVLTLEKPLKSLVIHNLNAELKKFVFIEKAWDQFHFEQSFDFRDLHPSDFPMCVKLHEIFEKHLKKLGEIAFKINLVGEVSMTASKFSYKDFLRCQNACNGGVAFILYLEDLRPKDDDDQEFANYGMESDESNCAADDSLDDSILPKTNRLVLFSADDLSHAQMAKVLRNDNAQLAISGWFNTRKINDVNNNSNVPDQAPSFAPIFVNHPAESQFAFEVDYQYLRRGVKYFAEHAEAIREIIVRYNCVSLEPFLTGNCYNMILTELESDQVKWKTVGSAARRKYEVAQMRKRQVSNCPAITKLLLKLQGSSFLKLLSLFIMKKLDDCKSNISVATEVIKFKKGDYMLVVDDLMYGERSSVDLWLFFAADYVDSNIAGDFGYFNKECNARICLTPTSNGAFIVTRTTQLLPFMSYMNDNIGDKILYAISLKYSVDYKVSELRQQLTRLEAVIREVSVICEADVEMAVAGEINKLGTHCPTSPMETDGDQSDEHDSVSPKRRRLV